MTQFAIGVAVGGVVMFVACAFYVLTMLEGIFRR